MLRQICGRKNPLRAVKYRGVLPRGWRAHEGNSSTRLPCALALSVVPTPDHCQEDDAAQGIKHCYHCHLQASPAHRLGCGKQVLQK